MAERGVHRAVSLCRLASGSLPLWRTKVGTCSASSTAPQPVSDPMPLTAQLPPVQAIFFFLSSPRSFESRRSSCISSPSNAYPACPLLCACSSSLEVRLVLWTRITTSLRRHCRRWTTNTIPRYYNPLDVPINRPLFAETFQFPPYEFVCLPLAVETRCLITPSFRPNEGLERALLVCFRPCDELDCVQGSEAG